MNTMRVFADMRRELEAEQLVKQGGNAPHISVTGEERDEKSRRSTPSSTPPDSSRATDRCPRPSVTSPASTRAT